MAIAAAAEALIERVDPNWVMETTRDAAARAAAYSPTDTCPNNSSARLGKVTVTSGTAPGRLSTATTT